MSDELKEELLDELQEYRDRKSAGVRAGNHAAAEDARVTFDNMSREVRDLIIE